MKKTYIQPETEIVLVCGMRVMDEDPNIIATSVHDDTGGKTTQTIGGTVKEGNDSHDPTAKGYTYNPWTTWDD